MADLFFKDNALKLLQHKYIVFFGDSNTRAIYKDVLTLLTKNSLIRQDDLKKKQEKSFCGDVLVNHSELNRGREYVEERSFKIGNTRVEFYFITRCYNAKIVDLMEDIHLGLHDAPDVIYINSTLWDVCRWGPNGVIDFKDNMNKLVRLFKSSLPESTLVIWATALPVSFSVQSSLLIKQINFLQGILRFDVMEANTFARQVMGSNGFDVLDLHFHMRMQVHRRVKDGVHYFPEAVRFLTNLLLTHLALTWNFTLPNEVETILLDKAKTNASVAPSSPTEKLKDLQKISNTATNTKKDSSKPKADDNKSRKPMIKELFRPAKRAKGKRREGFQGRGAFSQRNYAPRPKRAGKRNQTWDSSSGKEQINYNPTAFQNTNFSDDHWPDRTFQDESRFQNEARFPRVFDDQFQNGRFEDTGLQSRAMFQDNNRFQSNRFGNDVRFGNGGFQNQGQFGNSRYAQSFFDNGIQQLANNIQQYANAFQRFDNFHRDDDPPEPQSHRQLLSNMVRTSRYAPY